MSCLWFEVVTEETEESAEPVFDFVMWTEKGAQ